jgi:hypothetical protein
MNVPDSLPAQLYLLSYDTHKQRVVTNYRLPYLLRAAVLTDLLISGHIADQGGKVHVVKDHHRLADPVLEGVLRQIAQSRPRAWSHWIGKDTRGTAQAVRNELETGRWVRVELRQPFLIFNRSYVRVSDTRVVKRLTAHITNALTAPMSRVSEREAALVAMAAAGELNTVLPRVRRRAHQQRITQLTERAGPAGQALRKVIQNLNAAVAG